MAVAKKLDLIGQNECDFWIQRIKFTLNQLKKTQTTNLLLTSVIENIFHVYFINKPCGNVKKQLQFEEKMLNADKTRLCLEGREKK